MTQARPPALVYWNSEPKLKFQEQRLVVTTGLTFSTVSKVTSWCGCLSEKDDGGGKERGITNIWIQFLILKLKKVIAKKLIWENMGSGHEKRKEKLGERKDVEKCLELVASWAAVWRFTTQVSFKASRELTSLSCFSTNKVTPPHTPTKEGGIIMLIRWWTTRKCSTWRSLPLSAFAFPPRSWMATSLYFTWWPFSLHLYNLHQSA